MPGNHVKIFFSVSRCGETLSQKAIQLLVQDMLVSPRVRSWIPVEWIRSVGTCTEQTSWTEDQFTVARSGGIRYYEKRVSEIVVRELKRAKPDA